MILKPVLRHDYKITLTFHDCSSNVSTRSLVAFERLIFCLIHIKFQGTLICQLCHFRAEKIIIVTNKSHSWEEYVLFYYNEDIIISYLTLLLDLYENFVKFDLFKFILTRRPIRILTSCKTNYCFIGNQSSIQYMLVYIINNMDIRCLLYTSRCV